MNKFQFKTISVLALGFLFSSIGFANPVHDFVASGDIDGLKTYLKHNPMSLEDFMAMDENHKTTMEVAVESGVYEMMDFVSKHAQSLKKQRTMPVAPVPVEVVVVEVAVAEVAVAVAVVAVVPAYRDRDDGMFYFDEELINPSFFHQTGRNSFRK